MKKLPAPGALSTSMLPPSCVTMPYVVERPRPVPAVLGLGGEERLEDVSLQVLAHAHSGVAHHQIGVVVIGLGLDGEPPRGASRRAR